MRLHRLLLTLPVAALAGCEVIGGIFKVGVWTGGLIVLAVIALLVWVVLKIFR